MKRRSEIYRRVGKREKLHKRKMMRRAGRDRRPKDTKKDLKGKEKC